MFEWFVCFVLIVELDVLFVGFVIYFVFFDLCSGVFMWIVDVEFDLLMWFNDGCCDGVGVFVFGMKDEGVELLCVVGGFYCFNFDFMFEWFVLLLVVIVNSIGFLLDGLKMYFCDLLVCEIFVCDYCVGGDVVNVWLFVWLIDVNGDLDGLIVDCDGGLWNV